MEGTTIAPTLSVLKRDARQFPLAESSNIRGMGIAMSATKKTDEIELLEDAWSRFERAVDLVLKSRPKDRWVKNAKSAKKRAGRATPKSTSRAS